MSDVTLNKNKNVTHKAKKSSIHYFCIKMLWELRMRLIVLNFSGCTQGRWWGEIEWEANNKSFPHLCVFVCLLACFGKGAKKMNSFDGYLSDCFGWSRLSQLDTRFLIVIFPSINRPKHSDNPSCFDLPRVDRQLNLGRNNWQAHGRSIAIVFCNYFLLNFI